MRASSWTWFCAAFSAAVATGAFAMLLPRPATPDVHKLRTDQPIHAALFRHSQRLSEDGTIPPGALIRAKEQLDRIRSRGSQYSAGIAPPVWSWLGPGNIGGRIRGLVIDPTNPSVIYVGAVTGGVWKTTNGGASWLPLDDFMGSLNIGCMVMDPANPQVLYIGTGEGFFESEEGTSNTAAVPGAGIFRTTDGGMTWNQLSSTSTPDFELVNRIAIDPNNPNILLAATSTGIWRSADGGASWNQSSTHNTYDLDFHPSNSLLAVAGTHDDGAMRSLDGGQTWLPSPSFTAHRTEIAFARSNPSIVYAAVSSADRIKIWKSFDGGATYALQTTGSGISTYAAYNNALWVNPNNSSQLMLGGVNVYRSSSSGATFANVFGGVHSDIHIFVEHPGFNNSSNKTLFVGTDGGIFRLPDFSTGSSVVNLNNNLGITQFYGAVMNPISGVAFGGTQDNYTLRYTGNVNGWTAAFGGDGGYASTDPNDPSYFYGGVYWAYHFRSTDGGASASYIHNTPVPITDAGNTSRVNFINHSILDPNNPNTMLVATERLWRTTNAKAGQPSWFIIKPSIVPGNRPTPPGGSHFAVYSPYNISTISVARGNSNLIWAGHNNGSLYKTIDGTATNPSWIRMDFGTPLPDRWISKIAIDPQDHNTVYVSFMGWEAGNLWVTHDGGANWTDISSGKLPDAPVACIAVNPLRQGWLYAGTDLGIFTSTDDGATWSYMNQGPANVPIEELNWTDNNRLLCVTHGRGLFTATINPQADVVSPHEYLQTEGTHWAGDLEDVWKSEDRRLTLRAHYVTARSLQNIQVEFVGRSQWTTLSRLEFHLESQSEKLEVQQKIDLFNYAQGIWEQVDSRQVTGSDASAVIQVTTNPSRFVSPSGEIRARVRLKEFLLDERQRWNAAFDLAMWRLEP